MKGKKWLPIKIIALVSVIFIGLLEAVNLMKDPEKTLRAATTEAVYSTVEKVSMTFEKPIGNSLDSEEDPVSDEAPGQAAARNELLRKMFLRKGTSYFTQSRWGAKPVPYELRDFQLLGPNELPVTTADRNSGIDKKISYEIDVQAYRVFDSDNGWGEWNPDNPPQLENITMVRKEGEWKTVSDPTRRYALR